jgi:hypothetical protein
MPSTAYPPVSRERMSNAVERNRARWLRAATVPGDAGVRSAVGGGKAVATWASEADETAVRNTPDVDFLQRRADSAAAFPALGQAGFVHRQVAGLSHFLDAPRTRARDAAQVFAAAPLRPRLPQLLDTPEG